MTEDKQYATDTSEEEAPSLKVEITNQPKEKKVIDNTVEDTQDIYDYKLSEEEMKEMTDAQ